MTSLMLSILLLDMLDDLLNINKMVQIIYPTELQLNNANASDTKADFLDLNISFHNDTVSTKYMMNGVILILLIFRSLMAMCLGVPLTVYMYLNLFALQEHHRIFVTSIFVTNS